MSVARMTGISAISPTSFAQAIQQGIDRATKTRRGVEGAWINEQSLKITAGTVSGYPVNRHVTFVREDERPMLIIA